MLDYQRDIMKKCDGLRNIIPDSSVPSAFRTHASKSDTKKNIKKIILSIDGDKRIKSKVLSINSGNYSSFNDFLSELNSNLHLDTSLHGGMIRILTPRRRHRILAVEELMDGGFYVCTGEEPIQGVMKNNSRLIKDSKANPTDLLPNLTSKLKPTSKVKTSQSMFTNELPDLKPPPQVSQFSRPSLKYMSYIHAGVNRLEPLQNKQCGVGQLNADRTQKLPGTLQILSTDNKLQGSRNVIIVRCNPDGIGRSALHVVMSRRAVHTLGQVLCKISEAFGSRWHHDPIRHLYFLNGREVRSVNELFRKDKVYIASGYAKMFGTSASYNIPHKGESKMQTQTHPMSLSVENIKTIISEFWPDNPEPASVIYQWERRLARALIHQKEKHDAVISSTDAKQVAMSSPYDLQMRPRIKGTLAYDDDKRDSGFEESSMIPKLSEQSNRLEKEDEPDNVKYNNPNSSKQSDVTGSKLGGILQVYAKSAQQQKVYNLQPRYKKWYYSDGTVDNKTKMPFESSTNKYPANMIVSQTLKSRVLDSAWSQKFPKWHDRLDIGKKVVNHTIERRDDLLKENHSTSNTSVQPHLFEPSYYQYQPPLVEADEKKEEQEERAEECPSKLPIEQPVASKSPIHSIKKLESNVATSSIIVEPAEHNAAHATMKLGDSKDAYSNVTDSTATMSLKVLLRKSEIKETSVNKTCSQSTHALSKFDASIKQEPDSKTSETKQTANLNDFKEDLKRRSRPTPSDTVSNRHSAIRTTFTKIGVSYVAVFVLRMITCDKDMPLNWNEMPDPDYLPKHFHIGRTVGDGNFAVVKLARRRDTGNQYAIKIIDKAKIKGKENMLINEITIMHKCEHPNIVHLYEEFETPKEIWLSMEFVKDGDLFDGIIQARKFTEPIAAGIVSDLADALFYLHSRLIVHRDLKPENVLLIRQKCGRIRVKLADFGLALEVKQNLFTVCGTPTYIAPEILAETGYGLEVDMWALGIITYILLCGFAPFRSPEKRQSKLFELIKKGVFEYISPYWDNISPGAKDLINKLLVVDRKQRLDALDTLIHPWVFGMGNTNMTPQSEQRRTEYCNELEKRAKVLENQHNSRNRQIYATAKAVDKPTGPSTQLPALDRYRAESIPIQKNAIRNGNSMLVPLPCINKKDIENDRMKPVKSRSEK